MRNHIFNLFSIPELLRIFKFPVLLYLLNLLFEFFDLYSTIKWIDSPLHFIGGFLIALSFYELLILSQRKGYVIFKEKYILFLFVISLVALIGILWEVYEFLLDIFFYYARQPSLVDTMKDLILDLLGACFAFIVYKKEK